LTAREGLGGLSVTQPRIVILDSKLKTPLDAAVFKEGSEVTILTCSHDEQAVLALKKAGCGVVIVDANEKGQVDLLAVETWLARQAVNSVMIEAGALLNGAFMQMGMIDELIIYMAPSVLGTEARGAFSMPTVSTLSDRVQLKYVGLEQLDEDIKLTYDVKKED